MVHTSGILSIFAFSATYRQPQSDQSRFHQVTQFHTDCVYHQEIAGTEPAILKERKMILKHLSASGRQIQFRSEPATHWNVQRRLNNGCQILHFTGHGSDEFMFFEDSEACGMAERYDVETLKKLFQDRHSKPGLVFLGVCASQNHGNALVEAGVPHVVAVESQQDVHDKAASIFSCAFYHALIAGNETVKVAFDIAVCTVKTKMPDAVAKFLLLPEGGDNHEVKMFDDLPKGNFEDVTPPLPPTFGLPDARITYFGGVELQEAVQQLRDPNVACVSIVGERGVGKTERMLQACQYIRERRGFDAIFYADCKQTDILDMILPMEESLTDKDYKQFYRLIGSALGMSSKSFPSAKDLHNFLVTSVEEKSKTRPFTILLALNIPDALDAGGLSKIQKGLVFVVENLHREIRNLKLLFTCKEKLLETNVYFRNKQRVHEVHPLGVKDSALLLIHLLPRPFLCTDMDAPRGCTSHEAYQLLENLPLMKVVKGHPGTLCLLGPHLLNNTPICSPHIEEMAIRYGENFKSVPYSKQFLENRAKDIASKAGLKDNKLMLVWVGATARANAEGRNLQSEDDDECYRSVPWRNLSLGLQHCLLDVQATDDVERQSEGGDNSIWIEGSGLSFSSPHCFLNGAGWGARGQCPGNKYVSSLKPRVMNGDELSFVRYILLRPEAHHRLTTCDGGSDADKNKYDDGEEDISLELFVRFCRRWWKPVMTTMSLIRDDWASGNPVKVHGFISMLEANNRVKEKDQPGIFLLRFSESCPGCLILTFTYKTSSGEARTNCPSSSFVATQHARITVRPGGKWKLHTSNKAERCYSSLDELVNKTSMLKILYPHKAKEEAFKTSSE